MSKRAARRAASPECKAVGNKLAKLRPHIKAVEAQSHKWKLMYKAETGALRGRIRELEDEVYGAREAVILLRMVAANFRHPILGGLSEDQLAEIEAWYEEECT